MSFPGLWSKAEEDHKHSNDFALLFKFQLFFKVWYDD